jgi:hypothetical protein
LLSKQQYNRIRQALASVTVDISRDVFAAIRSSYHLAIDLRWKHVHINSRSLHKIAHLIESGRILTLHAPDQSKLPSELRQQPDTAVYLEAPDVLLLGSGFYNTKYLRSVVLHELVHTRLDRKGKTMPDLTSEEAAFIFQFTYLRRVNFVPPRSVPIATAIFKVADSLLAGQQPSAADVSSMQNLVRTHPAYVRQFQVSGNVRVYDGIRK